MKTPNPVGMPTPARARWRFLVLCSLAVLALPAATGRAEEDLRIMVRDAQRHQPIRKFQIIAGVRSQAGGEGSREIINWQPHMLREGEDGELFWPMERAYEEMALRVEAEGYAPQAQAWIRKVDRPRSIVVELTADRGTDGRILLPCGAPAAGATVALAMVQRDAVLEGGALRGADSPPPASLSDRWRRPRILHADAAGRVHLPPESDPTAALLVIHERGVGELPLADFKRKPEWVLQPWGRIEGTAQWADLIETNRTVSLIVHRDTYGYPGVIAQYERATTAADGSFVFPRVLPGGVQLSCPISATPGNKSGITEINLSPLLTHLTVKPGTNRAMVGGMGRLVRGRLVGRTAWQDITLEFHPPAPHIGFDGDSEMLQAWNELRNSRVGPRFFRSAVKVRPEGTFEIPDVLPGDYQILFVHERDRAAIATGRFTVAGEVPGAKPEPQDIGEIRAEPQ